MSACPTVDEILSTLDTGVRIGHGAFGVVYKVGNFVVKTMSLSTGHKKQMFAKEQEILHRLATAKSLQPYLPQLCWTHATDEKGYILQRYEPVIPLNEFLETLKTQGKTWNVAIGGAYIVNLLKAVNNLHAIGILHRDIKPGNLLVRTASPAEQKVPILIDFGLSCAEGTCTNGGVGSLGYFALNFLPKSYRSSLQRKFTLKRPGGLNRLVTGKTHNDVVQAYTTRLTDKYALATTIQEIIDRLSWPSTAAAKATKESLEEKYVLSVKGKLIAQLAAATAGKQIRTRERNAEQLAHQKDQLKTVSAEAAEEARRRQFVTLLRKYTSQNSQTPPTRKRRASI